MQKLIQWLNIGAVFKGVGYAFIGALAVAVVGGASWTSFSVAIAAGPAIENVGAAAKEGLEAPAETQVAMAKRPDTTTAKLDEQAVPEMAPVVDDEEAGEVSEIVKDVAVSEVTVAPVPIAAPLDLRKKALASRMRFSSVNVTRANYQRELNCLATGLYFEARGETPEGQLAVAEVILNRVASKYYPNSICGVLYQGANRKTGCQFSFACDGVPDIPRNAKAWAKMKKLAEQVLDGYDADTLVGGATYYHADYVNPRWARAMTPVAKIGRHIFYEYKTSPRRL